MQHRWDSAGLHLLYIEKFSPLSLPGEKLLWTGKAGGGLMLTPRDFFMIPFSLLWGGFAIFWEYEAMRGLAKTPGAFGGLFGSVFVVFGLYIMIGRFFVDAYARSKTFYALTDSRLLILREGAFRSIQSFQLHQLPSAQYSGPTSGTGTIDLSEGGMSRSLASWTPSFAKGARLLKIENAWQVFTLIQQTQFQLKSATR